jgi:hypothetical protein
MAKTSTNPGSSSIIFYLCKPFSSITYFIPALLCKSFDIIIKAFNSSEVVLISANLDSIKQLIDLVADSKSGPVSPLVAALSSRIQFSTNIRKISSRDVFESLMEFSNNILNRSRVCKFQIKGCEHIPKVSIWKMKESDAISVILAMKVVIRAFADKLKAESFLNETIRFLREIIKGFDLDSSKVLKDSS